MAVKTFYMVKYRLKLHCAIVILCYLVLFLLIPGYEAIEQNGTYVSFTLEDFKCTVPDVTSVDTELDLSRFRADFSKISEVKFPSLIGPLNEKLICKIKCIDGNWVGPLCSNTEDGRYQPILRECAYNKDQFPLLSITFKNSSIMEPTLFPHGSVVAARCRLLGLYKLKGEGSMRCENGEWTPRFPECVPTTLITNFTGDAPPTILYTLVSGSAAVGPEGALHVYPDSSLRLDCITRRSTGRPDWAWTRPAESSPEWSPDDAEKDTHFRLTLNKVTPRHSDQYTCTTATGHTNTITIKVVHVVCPQQNESSPPLIAFSEGTRLGHSVHFSCRKGFHLNGASVITCGSDGLWSAPIPTCVETFCPVLRSLGPHLSVVEYNSSFGGRAVFACSWGYRLIGPPGLECEQDGTWSGDIPSCMPIYCPKPVVPENGRLLTEASNRDGKYPVGDLMIYTCDEGFQFVGESSIVCTENGFWSHPPPFCVPPSEVRKSDTIYLENTTLVHVDE
ncbi:hypothetical protein JYU34_000105 [Plutella xylostella]|uniref:Locomotion-related protein Hikaru genki n=1 Tax=Plutella xylostella TaxID=51655 RepID=A0ABQ7R6V2_PLUXY|nr:hypothetical protein JYU34_000105 [Plutella xylostella]